MRTISEIKEAIVEDFMHNKHLAKAYGFTWGDDFSNHFSKVSFESVLFYIFACASWAIENLFASHKEEVTTMIETIMPHRPKWYRDKALYFMRDKALITDTDRYDISNMTAEDIFAAKVVKHAVAVENRDASILTIKVAGESGGGRSPLDEKAQTQLSAYLSEIKDAGVRISLVNTSPDRLDCDVDIYYDPMRESAGVEALCRSAIKNYVENLPFNGEYTNMALVDRLQGIEGVKIVEFRGATTVTNGDTAIIPINARYVPIAGYFKVGSLTVNMIPYEQV